MSTKFHLNQSKDTLLPMSLSHLAYSYLSACDIKVSKQFLEQRINSHPDYPALLSFTDTLDELGLTYEAVQAEENHVTQFNFPFLAQTPKAVGGYEIVHSLEYYEKNRKDFLNRWEGVALMLHPNQKIGNGAHNVILEKEKTVGLKHYAAIAAGLFIYLLIGLSNFQPFLFVFSILSIAGIITCGLIILHKLGKSNVLTKQLCSTDKSHGCDLVLNSKASQIIKGVDFGDAGMIWFSSLFLFSLLSNFFSDTATALLFLFIACIIALFFTFFSLWYQWRVVKAWCKMCLIVVGTVWLQTLLLSFEFLQYDKWFPTSILSSVYLFVCVLFLSSTWLLIKPLIKLDNELNAKNIQLLKWKRNPEIFQSLLTKQEPVNTAIPGNIACMGNRNASLQLTIVSNPFCRPCAMAHRQVEELYKQFPQQVAVSNILLIRDATDKENRVTVAAEHILNAISENHPVEKVLHNWFETMQIIKFTTQYPLIQQKNSTNKLLRGYQQWVNKNNIPYTPFIYLNGYPLPKQYSVEDIASFVMELNERTVLSNTKEVTNEANLDFSWQ